MYERYEGFRKFAFRNIEFLVNNNNEQQQQQQQCEFNFLMYFWLWWKAISVKCVTSSSFNEFFFWEVIFAQSEFESQQNSIVCN